jgi:RNA polymerase sigma factor (sigma-70 family)
MTPIVSGPIVGTASSRFSRFGGGGEGDEPLSARCRGAGHEICDHGGWRVRRRRYTAMAVGRARGRASATDGFAVTAWFDRYRQCVADPSTSDLLRDAAGGDQWAWDQLVERYSRLVWAVTRGHRLAHSDSADVFQTTWLRLVEHVEHVRDPEHLAGWLSTTARHECLRVLRIGRRERPDEDVAESADRTSSAGPGPEAALLVDEERATVAEAFARLSERCQALLRLVVAEPGLSYTEISLALGIPVGSIGPTRGRCLRNLKELLEVRG